MRTLAAEHILEELNARFEGESPEAIVRWAAVPTNELVLSEPPPVDVL